ncbi:hypothetical protein [Citrobacter cronae]|uniref:Uncharacterized protein n=1 Tax=Citrobacter cronae TaxID=1748967 RepID=A0A7X1BT37_9ENTR|nr:hypothetical protein [Citrobacter cronae]EBD5843817.1 hypothetical protein [Salmonella enterica]EDD5452690.1 hypothetical protein [Salmonella enterica subsp. enterica serovar Paratyphi B]EBD6593453.1 hypothetical protein [Salmonella enterica]EDE4810624.1 hypothetical protein [Salmonella enterica subsp. enterica serovar Paratyphi B]MBC2622132.1 hypothetical protein [Citrobacter cronae]
MTSIITTLYEKFSFRVLTVPLIIFSIEFLIWAVLIRENVISGDWAIYRTSLFACVLALLATGFIFQNSDYLKAAIGLLVCLALGFLILVMCYIGSLDFSFLTAKMITIFMMANFGSQIITCIIGKVDI